MKAKPIGRKRKSQPVINTKTQPDAAGIDVGAEEFVVAVPPGRCDDPVRTYASFTNGVHALRDWLIQCCIKTAAMESTGNYWITLYDTLIAAGIEVYLVNARQRCSRQENRCLRCPVAPTAPRRRITAQIISPRARHRAPAVSHVPPRRDGRRRSQTTPAHPKIPHRDEHQDPTCI